jgi:hypothetical protein
MIGLSRTEFQAKDTEICLHAIYECIKVCFEE